MGAKMFDKQLADALKMPMNSKKVNENTELIFSKSCKKNELKTALRILDEADAVNRYVWYNLPVDLTSQELERLLYYKGQLAFFYYEEMGKFYFMPYALQGTIDFYGRYNAIHPIPIANAGGTTADENKNIEAQKAILASKTYKCIYDVLLEEEVDEDIILNSCVLLHDYTKQNPETIIPRYKVNEFFTDIMSDIIPYLETALLVGTGTKGYRVQSASEKDEVEECADAIYNAALNKNPYVAILGNIEFQELDNGTLLQIQDYLMAMQSIDNFRLSTYGIANGGFFEKKAHVLESENSLNNSNTMNSYQDGLKIRQEFCNRVNAIWDLGIWCDVSESVMGQDLNGDGVAIDETPSVYESGDVGGSSITGGEE